MDLTSVSQLLMTLGIGLGLSAACGFRVFIPPLVAGLAAHAGYLELGESFAWLSSPPALVTLGIAAMLEIGAYCVPWVDNLLDAATAPAAVVAGTLLSASVLADNLSPLLQWSFALIAGGGIAGMCHGITAFLRGTSTVTTGGVGNPLLSTTEAGVAVALPLLTILLNALVLLVVLGLVALGIRMILRRRAALAAIPLGNS